MESSLLARYYDIRDDYFHAVPADMVEEAQRLFDRWVRSCGMNPKRLGALKFGMGNQGHYAEYKTAAIKLLAWIDDHPESKCD